MNNWKEELKIKWVCDAGDLSSYAKVLEIRDVEIFISRQVQYVLEQIEEAKLSELGSVIEKLKEEYK